MEGENKGKHFNISNIIAVCVHLSPHEHANTLFTLTLMPRSHLERVYSSSLLLSPLLSSSLLSSSPSSSPPLSPPLCSGPLLSPLCPPLHSSLSSPFSSPLLSSIISSPALCLPLKKKKKRNTRSIIICVNLPVVRRACALLFTFLDAN